MCTPVLSPLDRVLNARLIRPGNRPVRYGAVNLHGDEAEVSLRRTLPLPKDTEMRGGAEFGQPRAASCAALRAEVRLRRLSLDLSRVNHICRRIASIKTLLIGSDCGTLTISLVLAPQLSTKATRASGFRPQ